MSWIFRKFQAAGQGFVDRQDVAKPASSPNPPRRPWSHTGLRPIEDFSRNFFGGPGVSPVPRRLKPAAPKTII